MLISKAFDVNLSAISWLEDLIINNSSSQENNNLEKQPQMFDGGVSQENNHPEEQPSETKSLLNQLAEIYDSITEGHLSIFDLQTLPDIQTFCDILLAHKNSLMTPKNSKLCLQYMDMLDVLKRVPKGRNNR